MSPSSELCWRTRAPWASGHSRREGSMGARRHFLGEPKSSSSPPWARITPSSARRARASSARCSGGESNVSSVLLATPERTAPCSLGNQCSGPSCSSHVRADRPRGSGESGTVSGAPDGSRISLAPLRATASCRILQHAREVPTWANHRDQGRNVLVSGIVLPPRSSRARPRRARPREWGSRPLLGMLSGPPGASRGALCRRAMCAGPRGPARTMF